MSTSIAKKRTALGASLVLALGIGASLCNRGTVRGRDDSTVEAKDQAKLVAARSLVADLEAQLRSTEKNLQKAKELLASLQGGGERGGAGQKDAPGNKKDNVDKKLEGVWRIVGINGHHDGEFKKPPYDEYKIMTAGHYLWLSFRPGSGEVLRSGGGTYCLKDGEYTARIDYSNSPDLRAIIGQEYKGRCRVDGDKWYHNGTVPNGAPFDELWERVH